MSLSIPGLMIILALNVFAQPLKRSGVIVDVTGKPIYNALVGFQGSSVLTRTDIDGHFHISVDQTSHHTYLTAGKFGFYNGAVPFLEQTNWYRIELKSVPKEDNTAYQWRTSSKDKGAPIADDTGEASACELCHFEVTEQWKQDAHSNSAKNKIFLSFFNGKDRNSKHIASPGYKTDFPNSNGNCAACHIPVLALDSPSEPNPNNAKGIEKEGIFCDFCHKIRGVTIDHTGSRPGIMSIEFLRPTKENQIFFGPYPDVFPGKDGYHPLYSKSHYCAPCHHGKFWDVLIYSEFQEWLNSSYRKENIHCQNCHMPAMGNMSRFAKKESGGIIRNPATIPSHVNLGIQNKAFMKQAISLDTRALITNENVLDIKVTITNTNAGHHYPTGNPMRNMILLVEAVDDQGNLLDMINGETVPIWGGVGSAADGNYSGLPGKGFAKILKDIVLYPDNRQKHFQYEYPAPHWRPVYIESDTRIPANSSDSSRYQFAIPQSISGPVRVTARLIFRRSYKQWADLKSLEIKDMEIAGQTMTVTRKK